jgi:hypothetical protein
VVCDPEYKVYQAFGLVEGKESQLLFDAPEDYQDRKPEAGKALSDERRE